MSAIVIFESVKALSVAICIFIVLGNLLKSFEYTVSENKRDIYKIACRDLSYIGRYDNRLEVSVKYWILSLEVALYKNNNQCTYIQLLRDWNTKYNYDPDSIILNGIENAHSIFLEELDNAKYENREPKFIIDKKYDYHNYPRTFTYNDYIKPDYLLNEIDSILGGA